MCPLPIYIYSYEGHVTDFGVCPSVPLLRFRHKITLSRYADNRIDNIMKVYIERNHLQLYLIRHREQMLTLFKLIFAKQCSIAHRTHISGISDTNHFGHCHFLTVIEDSDSFLHSVFDSLGQLACVSQCMASVAKSQLFIW